MQVTLYKILTDNSEQRLCHALTKATGEGFYPLGGISYSSGRWSALLNKTVPGDWQTSDPPPNTGIQVLHEDGGIVDWCHKEFLSPSELGWRLAED